MEAFTEKMYQTSRRAKYGHWSSLLDIEAPKASTMLNNTKCKAVGSSLNQNEDFEERWYELVSWNILCEKEKKKEDWLKWNTVTGR